MPFSRRCSALAHQSPSPLTVAQLLFFRQFSSVREYSDSSRHWWSAKISTNRFPRPTSLHGKGTRVAASPGFETRPTPILLDTHTLLWLVSAPDQVSVDAREAIADPSREVMVSAVSAWEIAIKTRLGRLDGEPLLSAWPDVIAAMTVTELAIDAADAIMAGRLPWDHRDPFDRMIVAQAARRGFTIATRDIQILSAALTPTVRV